MVDGAAAVRALAARLDVAYQPWVSGLTAAQRAAIVAWQGMDRHYEEIQAVLRGTRVATAAVSEEIGLLVQAVMGGRVPFEIPVWKGVRSVEAVFGAARPNVGLEVGQDGFFAVTLDRDLAVREFTDPPGAPRAGLLAMTLHEGQHAAWIAAVGDPALRVQQEMLTLFAVTLRVNQVAYPEGESGLPVITVEVSEP